MQGRMSVLQELMFSDSVLVGDVALRTTQRSSLHHSPDHRGHTEQPPTEELGSVQTVEHVLRLEMPLKQIRDHANDDVPLLRPSSWQIADWNWACSGNHPALPRDVPAPW